MIKPSSTTLAKIYLTEPQRLMVYRLYAEFKSPAKVRGLLASEYNINVSDQFIHQICKSTSGMPFVQKFRDEFLMRVKDVPIANKRVRLEELDKNRVELNDLRELPPTDTAEGRNERSMLMRRINETVCAAREEVEGKPLLMQQFNISANSHLTDEELNKRINELTSKASGLKTIEVAKDNL